MSEEQPPKMIVAQMTIVSGQRFLGEGAACHGVDFDSVEAATAEFERVGDLMKRREDRANELDKIVLVKGGCGQTVTIPLDEIRSIALHDYALANARQQGLRDAFPNLFKR